MKIGYIDYLNCYPFYYHMFEKEKLDGVDVVSAYPGQLNNMIIKNELDLSPVSAAVYSETRDQVYIISDLCLSSIGYVKSVVLLSKIPIEELNGKSVALSSASMTSVVLLKILLSKYYNLDVKYTEVGPEPSLNGFDAKLVIGNEAMLHTSTPVQYSYDLGDLWLRKTGHPVVFAIFVVQKKFAEENLEKVNLVIQSFKKSLNEMDIDRKRVIDYASQKYPDIDYDINRYYDLLKYNFSQDLKEALQFYFNSASSLGLLKKVDKLNFLL